MFNFNQIAPKFLNLSSHTSHTTHQSADTTLLGIPVIGDNTYLQIPQRGPGRVDATLLPVALRAAVVMEDL